MHSPLQKRERTGKEYGCFQPRHSNERSTKFESLEQEQKYFEEENGKMIALQISPKIESLYKLGRQATNFEGFVWSFPTFAGLPFGQFSSENSQT